MRRVLLAVAVVAGLAGAGVAQDAEAPAIQGVIQNQMDAFLKENSAEAFNFASPMIQGIFGSPGNFGAMVRNSYPMIWKPSSVQYLGLRKENGLLLQRVLVKDASGAIFLFDYEMVPQPDGWRINGVFPVREGGAGA